MPVRILEISWSGFWRFLGQDLDRHSINFELMVLEDYLELDKILETGNQLRSKFLFFGVLEHRDPSIWYLDPST